MSLVIKQLEERNVANDIEFVLWNDRMDLIALSNDKGEVALHRLSWSRCWSLTPPKEGVTVKGLAWRPDGKVLAIAYSNGTVLLVHIENKNVVHKLLVNGNITCVFWFKEKVEIKTSLIGDEEQSNLAMKHLDSWKKFLPNLPPLSNAGPSLSNTQDPNLNFNLIREQEELNLLVVGTEEGYLQVYIFGQFPCADINMNAYLNCSCSVICAHFSDNLALLHVTVKDQWGKLNIVTINTEVFKTHTKELHAIAVKHGYLSNLVTYLTDSILPIKETWETFLMEMDAKLHNYASKVPENTLSADFLDLLLFGICSDEMQAFLLQDLTEKGLKKFGQVIEMCYSNIQKMLLKHVTKASQSITYHLAELRGMARLKHRYKVVGLGEEAITDSITASGAFLVKVDEMHQVIDDFMINYKAFFRWLYIAIANLMEMPVPPDVPKNTQQDIIHITNFILNFDNIGTKKEDPTKTTQFTMERLGQYLEDNPLTIAVKNDDNIWEQFLASNECIRDHPGTIKRYKSYSLIQQIKHLTASIDNIFEAPRTLITQQCTFKNIVGSLEFQSEPVRITNTNFNDVHSNSKSTLIAFLTTIPPAEGIYFMKVTNENTNCSFVYFRQLDNLSDGYQVVDVKFYNSNILSVLLQEHGTRFGIIYQLPVVALIDEIQKNENGGNNQIMLEINGLQLGSAVLKQVEGMICNKIAVSGSRKVSLVLAENKKKVKLFEMEAEEDDDEDIEMNSTRESDVSMQEDSSVIT